MAETETKSTTDIQKALSPSRMILPILIGLGVIFYLVWRDWDSDSVEAIDWGYSTIFFVILAILAGAGRLFAFAWRLNILSEGKLKAKAAFQVSALWEFSSSITPTMVGGTAVALYFLTKEKIKAGETTTIILTIVFLDSSLFLLSTLLLWLALGNIFIAPLPVKDWIWVSFTGAFAMMSIYTLLIGYGLFFRPQSFKGILDVIASIPFLKRWKESILQMGDDVVIASQGLRTKGLNYWLKGYAATILAWSTRFLVVNFLVLAVISGADHFLLFARQFALYLILILTPTPGAAGVADMAFGGFFMDIIQNSGLAAALGAIWRLLTYYPYLIIGVIVLPAWLGRVYKRDQN